MVGTSSFYGVPVDGQTESGTASTAEILGVFEILKPRASTTPLIRIGGDHDGSYLVPDALDGVAACFSPGVNRIKYFEDFLTDRYGIQSHMCDFSCDVDQFKTPLKPGMQTFVKKWLDVTPGEDNISLEEWIREHDVDGDLLLQMDIEGAEYRNILATPDETLARFRVFVLEVHGLGKLLDGPTLHGVIAPFFNKLSRNFTSVHAHPNNCCGEFTVPGTDIRIPNVLELTLIRNDRFTPASGPPSLPHPLDVSANVPRRPPLFLSHAWCDYERPLESRVKMLEDKLRYRDSVVQASPEAELSGLVSMAMRSLQTVAEMGRSARHHDGDLVEVGRGRAYVLSSAYGSSRRRGVVEPDENYFFHTEFGRDQFIRVDLGRPSRVSRIEVENRRNGFQERARNLFVVLSQAASPGGATSVFPLTRGFQDTWAECGVDIPNVSARFVTITSPMNTALHFADLRIYARAQRPRATLRLARTVKRVLRDATARVRRCQERRRRRAT